VRFPLKSQENFTAKQAVPIVDILGGVSYGTSNESIAFKGQLIAQHGKERYAVTGYSYSAEWLLITDTNVILNPIDTVIRENNNSSFIVSSVVNMQNHNEFYLERK